MSVSRTSEIHSAGKMFNLRLRVIRQLAMDVFPRDRLLCLNPLIRKPSQQSVGAGALQPVDRKQIDKAVTKTTM